MLKKSNLFSRRATGSILGISILGMMGLALTVSVLCETTRAQTTDKTVTGAGEVTVNDLYVRSGDSSNHYTITKLKAGDRLTVVGQRGNWYEILPPADTFSLISGDYVDTADDRTGVVNGNRVRVRAGSLLNDNKYTVQVQLSKGTQVTILGRNPDGFLKITPPSDATLWVNRDYVQMVPQDRLAHEVNSSAKTPARATTLAPETSAPTTTDSTVQKALQAVETKSDKPAAAPIQSVTSAITKPTRKDTVVSTGTDGIHISAFKGLPPTDQRRVLDRIDVASQMEMAKPMFQRNWQPLIKRYQTVSHQQEDELASAYALKRIDQVHKMIELVETVKKMRQLNEIAESKRRESLVGRSSIQAVIPPPPSGIDAKGELRVSALYPPGTIPQRFRLVHVSSEGERTIGYVEIPVGSSLTVDSLLGKQVGVRASSRKLQEGGVEAMPIYVAKELILLEEEPANSQSND